jgi:hypothetical protein
MCRKNKVGDQEVVLCLSSGEMGLREYHDLFKQLEECLK